MSMRKALEPGDVGRKIGVRPQTLAPSRERYSGMTVEEAKEKKRLKDENTRLRQLVAQYALDNAALKSALGKKW